MCEGQLSRTAICLSIVLSTEVLSIAIPKSATEDSPGTNAGSDGWKTKLRAWLDLSAESCG